MSREPGIGGKALKPRSHSPKQYDPTLVKALRAFAVRLSACSQHDSALSSLEEALPIVRKLADGDPEMDSESERQSSRYAGSIRG